MKLVAATNNKNKLEEFKRILEPLGVEVLSQKEVGVHIQPEENGATFAENAWIKAKTIFDATGLPTVADDSGLCIDALGGRPGVYSARYHGENTPYPEKMQALLNELKDVEDSARTAQFVCAIACAWDKDTKIETTGVCHGKIGYQPLGDGGFGYDPIFMVGEKSYSQLSGEEKDAISHRGIALREFYHKIKTEIENKNTASSKCQRQG